MKKAVTSRICRFILCALFVVSLGLSGCGGANEQSQTSTEPEQMEDLTDDTMMEMPDGAGKPKETKEKEETKEGKKE